MRASRLLSIQMLLQTRGRLSARTLAAALEVSVRTLHRDIDALSAAGVPVFAERGRAGGFALMPGWTTRLTGMTPGESQAMLLAGLDGPAIQLGLGPDLRGARLKLLTALPAAWRSDAERISARLHFDPLDWYRDSAPVPHLAAVAAAVWAGQALRLRYASWHATTERRVNPLGLVLKAGDWYLVAAQTGKPPRTYRVASIEAVTVLVDQAVPHRDAFDLAGYWRQSLARFTHALAREQATVRATPEGLRLLAQLNAATARAVAASGCGPAAGPVTLSIPMESLAHASRQLLGLADAVEVLAPPALRQAVQGLLRRALAAYR